MIVVEVVFLDQASILELVDSKFQLVVLLEGVGLVFPVVMLVY